MLVPRRRRIRRHRIRFRRRSRFYRRSFWSFSLVLGSLFIAALLVGLFGPSLFAVGSPQPISKPTPVPTVSPTPIPDGNNLATIPLDWITSYSHDVMGIGGSYEQRTGDPDFGTFDSAVYPVTHDGYSCLELDSSPVIVHMNFPDTNELDLSWMPLSAGVTHIYFSAWFETSAATTDESGDAFAGARLGMDMYAGGRICEVSDPNGLALYPDYPSSSLQCHVPFGTSVWTQVVLDFTVPSIYVADPWGAYPPDPNTGQVQHIVPTGCIPYILIASGDPTHESGKVWARDPVMYVDP